MKKDNRYTAALIIDVLLALLLWLILIALKAVGAVDIHWALVLSGLVWISWALFALTALAGATMWLLVRLKRWYRRRKVDRRIIRQAKAAGVWERPRALGGRALELKAWKDFKITRRYAESDAALRRRCMNAAENEYARKDWRENGPKKQY